MTYWQCGEKLGLGRMNRNIPDSIDRISVFQNVERDISPLIRHDSEILESLIDQVDDEHPSYEQSPSKITSVDPTRQSYFSKGKPSINNDNLLPHASLQISFEKHLIPSF